MTHSEGLAGAGRPAVFGDAEENETVSLLLLVLCVTATSTIAFDIT